MFWSDLGNKFVWVVLTVTLLFGAVGWVDDYKKLVKGDPKGLKARYKYLWQSVIGLGCALFLYYTATNPAETHLIVPFFKAVAENIAASQYHQIFYDQMLGPDVGRVVNDVSQDLASGVITPEEAAEQVQQAYEDATF